MSESEVPAFDRENFLLGSLRSLLRDPLVFLEEGRRRYGSRFRFRLLKKQVWVFSDPSDVHKIFFDCASCLEKSSQRAAFGKSVLTSNGDDWKRMRRSVAPFFARERLEAFLPLIFQASEAAAQKGARTRDLELYEFLGQIVNDIIVVVLFGRTADGKIGDLRGPTEALTDYALKFSALPFPLPEWLPLPAIQKKRRALRFFDEMLAGLLASNPKVDERLTFLQSLSRMGEVSTEEIRTQCLAFYLAGFETTVNALFWTFLEILRRPELEKELRTEARAALGQDLSTTEKLEEALPLLRSVLMESLRLMPPIWFRTRVAQSDFDLNGARIRKGDLVWVSPYLSQRSEAAWPHATRFEARRFLGQPWPKDENYFPFSLALNTCTGKDLAWMEMLVVCAVLLARLEWRSKDPLPDFFPRKTRVSIRPDEKLEVQVTNS